MTELKPVDVEKLLAEENEASNSKKSSFKKSINFKPLTYNPLADPITQITADLNSPLVKSQKNSKYSRNRISYKENLPDLKTQSQTSAEAETKPINLQEDMDIIYSKTDEPYMFMTDFSLVMDWKFKENIIAGLNLAFVNLPFNMTFATAANLSPANGIISSFWSGFWMIFSDSKYCVLTVSMSIALLTRPLVNSYGEDGYLYCLFITGVIMFVLLFTGLYRYMVIVPKSVMDGFMNAQIFSVLTYQLPMIFTIDIVYKDEDTMIA